MRRPKRRIPEAAFLRMIWLLTRRNRYPMLSNFHGIDLNFKDFLDMQMAEHMVLMRMDPGTSTQRWPYSQAISR